LIQILAEIAETCGSQKEYVELQQKPLLLLWFVRVIPNISLNAS
jgi:hypothetical protein